MLSNADLNANSEMYVSRKVHIIILDNYKLMNDLCDKLLVPLRLS